MESPHRMNNYTLRLDLTLFPNSYQSNQCKLNEPVVADTVTLCYTHILSDE